MAEVLDVRGRQPDPAAIARAVDALRAGEPVVVPTETVYGVAVDPFAEGATDRLFAVKERPKDVPIAVIVGGAVQAATLVDDIDEAAGRLMATFWPGPLTLVMRRRKGLHVDLGVDAHTIGLRCPDHPVAHRLAERVGPIATTSANRHGEPPATTAEALVEVFGDDVAIILDAGPCEGQPSTVLDLTGTSPVVLRPGPVTQAQIDDALTGH